MAEKKQQKNRGNSTKDTILLKANGFITDVGMSEFRIDTLASSLGLSPGNITYHFHKKEDIASSLWDCVIVNVRKSYMRHISTILDIKQLFLFFRSIVIENFKYRGIISYMLSDVSFSRDQSDSEGDLYTIIYSKFNTIITSLVKNGYIVKNYKDEDMLTCFNSMFIIMSWWLSVNNDASKYSSIDEFGSSYAISIISNLEPYMSEKGLEQYKDVVLQTKEQK